MFALMKHPIPKLRAFTACLWLRPAGGGIGTPISYAVPEEPNEMVLLQGLHAPAELLVNGKVLQESVGSGPEAAPTAKLIPAGGQSDFPRKCQSDQSLKTSL